MKLSLLLIAATLHCEPGDAKKPKRSRESQATQDAKDAVMHGDVERLQRAIERGADLSDRRGRGTVLLLAVLRTSVESVELLLASGANPELGNHDGTTPWMAAAFQNDVPTLRALADGGANVQAFGVDGWSALHRATWRPGEDAVAAIAYLLTLLPVDVAAVQHDFPKPRKKSRLNAGHSARAVVGATALMEASAHGQHHGVRMLLAAGASVANADAMGDTALHYAVSITGSDEVVGLLVAAGADPHARNRRGVVRGPPDGEQLLHLCLSALQANKKRLENKLCCVARAEPG
eukprot:SAG11_NODE_7_length_31267_cov_19.541966_22_plen_292_part_00